MFQFPLNPAVGDLFNPTAGVTFRWNGVAWYLQAGPGAFITQAEADLRYVELSEVPNVSNKLINGKFAIDQRNAGASVSAVGGSGLTPFPVDRWKISASAASVGSFAAQRQADGSEFYLSIGTGAPDALVAGSLYIVGQIIEGVQIQDLQWGTVNASPITVAFDIVSSITGTFPLAIGNGLANRAYITTFTVNAPGVRETKIITIPGDTAGTWANDTGIGIRFNMTLGAGTTFQAAAPNVWGAGNFYSVPGCTNLMAATGRSWAIRNVRIYKGSADFGPDRRLYADEVELCQRYFEKSFLLGTVPASGVGGAGYHTAPCLGNGVPTFSGVSFVTRKRSAPTIVLFNPTTAASANARNFTAGVDYTGTASTGIGDRGFTVSGTGAALMVLGQDFSVHWTASAEL